MPLVNAGLYGGLGDLGAIDSTYDVSISTAACGALNNLVVETTSGAQPCNSSGKEAPRLFDLVKVNDDKYLPAFYYALRDTLVAKELDEASAIAYQGLKCKYRVVVERLIKVFDA
ncbi:hypothetical protein PsorP6_008674 [Peronosclerospora sorghi]|uniref:Uncharacterized protein n=1 Tax=Peronosclerospora sorghi TaxID=230839 RepID=A0ACC0VZ32_9STRA|nr:hypothetical protein PsorP6_008674 [Peronosclerospora sorghi]